MQLLGERLRPLLRVLWKITRLRPRPTKALVSIDIDISDAPGFTLTVALSLTVIDLGVLSLVGFEEHVCALGRERSAQQVIPHERIAR